MCFIPLHVHSQFSILDSTCSIQKIANKASEWGISAVALTDQGNMFGAVEFFKMMTAKGIKPILGCEVWAAPRSRLEKKKKPGEPAGFPLILLAKNNQGYHNLAKISSIGYLEGFYYYPRVDKEIIEKYKEGLICLSGSTNARIPYLICQDREEEVLEEINWYHQVFGEDFYFEVQRHQMSETAMEKDGMHRESWIVQYHDEFTNRQKKVTDQLASFSKKYGISLVATNDTHYMEREDFKAHEILINIQSGEPCVIWERDSKGNPKNRVANPKRKVYPSHEYYFKSPDEMSQLFADMPEVIQNTYKVSEKCLVDLDFKTKHYPVFIPPSLEGKKVDKEFLIKETEKHLYELCEKGIHKRYDQERLKKVHEKYPNEDPLEIVQKRLDYEFKIISSKGMCDYLLIVYDFIAWAKKHEIPVGPGRGSAAGSIIAYLLGITDIEPLRFHLFFERFINPERISYPDIDVDICMDRRQEVIEYMIQKYGQEKVAQIITFGTMKAKMAIKDVGRVLSVPLAKVNAIAKLVPEDPKMTLEKALNIDPELKAMYSSDEDAQMIIDMAKKTEGSIRNTSIHAAGLIVSEDNVMEHIPVCNAKDSQMIVTQYAMKPVESLGMLKIDFLGLKTLTSIQTAVEAIKKRTKKAIDWANLPLDDKKAFELLNQGKTLGVFQVESGGMQELSKRLHIDHFEEIIAVGALYRPGPMDMIPSFIQRKHGKEKIEIDHPLMKDVLQETYGVMVYQEQVMQIASLLAGYTLGEGDVLRRAMGKKDQEEMTRQRKKFLEGAENKGIDGNIAINIFNKIEKFASYGFNKSHAAAYAYLTYVTAFLKANYPREWMAALMTSDRYDLSKVAKFIQEAKSMGILMLPPDVNEAGKEFLAVSDGIRFAMSGIKGVGSAVVESILQERDKSGSFSSFYDFIKRVDKSRVSKKNIELMIQAGCFDFTNWSRDQMRTSLDAMYDHTSQEQKELSRGVMNFFSLIEEEIPQQFRSAPKVVQNSSKMDILRLEKELLGFYLTGHPMDSYRNLLKRLSCVPLREFHSFSQDALLRTGFIVEKVQFRISSKNGRKFAILTISDGLERFELPIWPEMYEEKHDLLEENRLLFAMIHLEKDSQSMRLNCRYLNDLIDFNEKKIKETDEIYDRLKASLKTRKKFDAKKKEKKQMKKNSFLHIEIDADQIRFSHILQLKQIFRSHSGTTPVNIVFYSATKEVGTICIDASWGIEFNEKLSEKIREISNISRFELMEV